MVTIRALEATDSLEEITDLLHRGYKRLADMGLQFVATDQDVETTRSRIAQGDCYVAVEGSKVVGTITVYTASLPPQDYYKAGRVAVFGQFAVDPSVQGKGIGKALVAKAEEHAKEFGCHELALDTAIPATHLIEMYEKWGFFKVDEIQWYGANYTSAILTKLLVPFQILDLRSYWNFGDPAASERRFRGLLPSAGEREAEVRSQIARTFSLRKQFDLCDKELDLAEAVVTISSRAQVGILLERGRCRNSAGRKEEALALFKEAEMAGAEEEDLLVDALHMQAIVLGGEEAATINERALKIVRSSVNPATTRWEASLLNNLGWAHHDLGSYEEALKAFEEAIPIRQKMGEKEPYLAARWCWARCLRSLGRYQEALEEQTELKKLNPSDQYIDEEIEALTAAMK